MQIRAEARRAADLMPLHELYRAEARCQLLRDSFWERGFLDAWSVEVEGHLAGYGAVANRYAEGRVLEFYTFPAYRRHALAMFRELLRASGPREIEAQSNVAQMALLLADCGTQIQAEKVLFADARATCLPCPGDGVFRRRMESGEMAIFEHRQEPVGDWVIEAHGRIVATGGFMTHYNPPWADLYMEVEEAERRRGFGSFLIQELKRVCYEAGRRPAARCDVANVASRRCLEKAGVLACGHLLVGQVR